MTARSCPTCGQIIDSLRAPVACVVGGKVVTYCSVVCKNAFATPALDADSSGGGGGAGEPRFPRVMEHTALPAPLPEPGEDHAAAPMEVTAEGDLTPVALATQPALIAATGPAAPGARTRGRRMAVVAGVSAAIAAGGVYASQSWRQPAAPRAAEVAAAPMLAPAPAPAPAPGHDGVAIDKTRLLADARQTLSAALGEPSPRVRQLAAMALSRTGAPEALAELENALASDSSEIRKLEVAYALARAGSSHGVEALVEALRASRRDVRLEAARALALLGDQRAVPRLKEVLSANQLRMGAAESLAILGDAEGLAILEEALKSQGAETRMRAAVALGRAGAVAGRDLLKAVVAESKLEIGADGALARLGDREAVPALTRALGLSALRVQAALGLRRLGVEPELGVLADALAASDEMAKISAAEAVLVLLAAEPPPELR